MTTPISPTPTAPKRSLKTVLSALAFFALALSALVILPVAPAAQATDAKPIISIQQTAACPGSDAVVTITTLYTQLTYDVTINGVTQEVINNNGTAVFDVPNAGPTVNVTIKWGTGGQKNVIDKTFTIDTIECPAFMVDVDACTTVGGTGKALLTFDKLDDSRTYSLKIDGKDPVTGSSTNGTWKYDIDLAPGTYKATISSEKTADKPKIGDLSMSFTVEPCPTEVKIALTQSCSTDKSDGSVAIKLTGFTEGREYDITFTSATGKSYPVTASTDTVTELPAGEYTMTVTDVDGRASNSSDEPLTFTRSITVKPCTRDVGVSPSSSNPPVDTSDNGNGGGVAGVDTLPVTGVETTGPLVLMSGVFALGGGLLALSIMRRRRAVTKN